MARSVRAQLSLGVILVLQASMGLADPASATYSYDDLGRLRGGEFTGGAANNRKVDYQYDAAGNRTTMTSGLAPTLSIAAAVGTVTEGGAITFPVTRTGTSTSTLTVQCVPEGNTALSDGRGPPFADFLTTAQTITFQPGEPSPTTKNCVIQTSDDAFYEQTQIMSAVLQNASAGAVIDQAHSRANGNIADNDPAPNFTIAPGSALEGSAIVVWITRNGWSELPYSVNYSTGNGTATTLDNDYTAVAPGTLSFTDLNQNQQLSFPISTTTDGKFEEPETISVAWQVNGSQMTAGTATINNDDARPNIIINDPPQVNEGSVVTFTLTNNGNTNTGVTHTVNWSTQNNSAAAGSDYTAVTNGSVTFAAGQSTRTIQVTTLTDGVAEGGAETFFVNLSTSDPATRAVTFGDTQGMATIADADNPVPSQVQNVRHSPANNTPHYEVAWDAATGAVSYYVLEEMQDATDVWGIAATLPSTTLRRLFADKPSADYYYRVKACSAANVCGPYGYALPRTVCNGMCD